MSRSIDGVDGSLELFQTILVDAIHLLVRARGDQARAEEWEEVRDWFTADSRETGSYRHTCECLGLPYAHLREYIFRLSPEELAELKLDV